MFGSTYSSGTNRSRFHFSVLDVWFYSRYWSRQRSAQNVILCLPSLYPIHVAWYWKVMDLASPAIRHNAKNVHPDIFFTRCPPVVLLFDVFLIYRLLKSVHVTIFLSSVMSFYTSPFGKEFGAKGHDLFHQSIFPGLSLLCIDNLSWYSSMT